MSASISQRFVDLEALIDGVITQLKGDAGVSPALQAVVEELHRKARDARDSLKNANERTIRDTVIEVEQAADSAKRAAEAEGQISDTTRRAVLAAHSALCALKSELPE